MRTLLPALLLVLLAELGARAWLGDDDDWKFWTLPVGERIDLLEARPQAPEVLFIGDSSAASNLVPEVFTEVTGLSSFNLGTRGNLIGSFEPTMLDHALPRLKNQPEILIVSFSPRNYDESPFFDSMAKAVNQSLYARSARGELIWADWFALARIRHRIRERLPNQNLDPTLDRAHGWQPFEYTVAHKRPHARSRLKKAPWVRESVPPELQLEVAEKLDIVQAVDAYAAGRPVFLLLPPMRHPATQSLVEQLQDRASPTTRIWDYTGADFERAEGAHMGEEAARAFTREVAKRVAEELK